MALSPYKIINQVVTVQSNSTFCSCEGGAKAKDYNLDEI